MRVGIVGSRGWTDRDAIVALVVALPPDATVVSGSCRGVDTWAAVAARERGLTVVEYAPEAEGPMRSYDEVCQRFRERNQRIAGDIELLHAFVSTDRRGGTEQTIRYARARGVPVVIHEMANCAAATPRARAGR